MIRDEPTTARLRSTPAGCLSIAILFAPAYAGMYEGTERVEQVCNVTHTHGAAHAAASTPTVLIYHAVNGESDVITPAERKAFPAASWCAAGSEHLLSVVT